MEDLRETGTAVSAYAPFETMRYDPSTRVADAAAPGFVRFDRHLARWERSCEWLGLNLDHQRVIAALNAAVADLQGAHRVRVTLGNCGEIEVTYTPLPHKAFNDTPLAAVEAARDLVRSGGALGKAALARQRVDESDPARAHKTTARELYYAARAYAESHGLDDVLFLDSQGLLAEGSISSVFLVHDLDGKAATDGAGRKDVDDSEWRVTTPPLSSGALPGVLREELVERGQVAVRELDETDLRSARSILLGSSVRGLRQVDLLESLVDVA